MTASFNEQGFCFQYPENWRVEREKTAGWPSTVSVHAPSGAFWMVTEDPRAPDLLDRMIDAMTEQYEDVETDAIERQVGPFLLRGRSMAFFCLDFLITAQAIQCDGSPRQLVIWMQAENREFDSLANVFDAMTLSLLSDD